MADQLTELVTTLGHAIGALGSAKDEQDLARMAAACRQCADDLHGMGRDIDTAITQRRAEWSGPAADNFGSMLDTYFTPAQRDEVVTSMRNAGDVLDQAREASHQTKVALEELIKSLVIAASASAVISLAAGAMGKYVAWAQRAKLAQQGARTAAPIVARMSAFLHRVVEPVQKVSARVRGANPGSTAVQSAKVSLVKTRPMTIGEQMGSWAARAGDSRLVRGLTLNGSENWSFGRTSLQALKNYWQTFALSGTGGYVSAGFGRVVNGQPFIAPFSLGYAQLANAAWVAGAMPFGTTWWSKQQAAHPARMNFAAGFAAGSIPSIMNDALQGKPMSQIGRNFATFGLMSGGFNAGMGRAFSKFGITDPKKVLGYGSFFGLVPGTVLRAAPVIGVPLAPAPDPLVVDSGDVPLVPPSVGPAQGSDGSASGSKE